MIESGEQPTYIIHMLTRYFTGLSRINELNEQKIPVQAAARIVGTHYFYYKDYLYARKLYSDEKVFNAARALLKADLSVKTTSADPKNVVSVLIAEIMQ
jgi:DNA polymerase III delta subunit